MIQGGYNIWLITTYFDVFQNDIQLIFLLCMEWDCINVMRVAILERQNSQTIGVLWFNNSSQFKYVMGSEWENGWGNSKAK